MNLTENEKEWFANWYIGRLIWRLSNVVKLHNAVKAIEEPTPIYLDTDSVIYYKADAKATKELLNRFYGVKNSDKMEEKKMTNRDALKELFGLEPAHKTCFAFLDVNSVCTGNIKCKDCKYYSDNWLKAEYKAPKRIVRRKVKYFTTLSNAMEFLKANNIAEKDVFRISKAEQMSLYEWCVQYDEVEYKVEENK